MTGVDDPYEVPQHPEGTIDSVALDPADSVNLVLAHLERIGAISASGAAR
jgi:sulfate adenylyltransferase